MERSFGPFFAKVLKPSVKLHDDLGAGTLVTPVQEPVMCVCVCVCRHIFDWKQIEIVFGIRFLKVTVNAEPRSAS